jgi:hypothetical protein
MRLMQENLLDFRRLVKNSEINSLTNNTTKLATIKEDFQKLLKEESLLEKNPKLLNAINETKISITNLFEKLNFFF